jgi:hypothetical protein
MMTWVLVGIDNQSYLLENGSTRNGGFVLICALFIEDVEAAAKS